MAHKLYPVYPKDFYDFADGVQVQTDEINRWIQEGIEDLRSGKAKDSTFLGSGNTMVIVFDMAGDDQYSVFVCPGYKESEIPRKKSTSKKVQVKRGKK